MMSFNGRKIREGIAGDPGKQLVIANTRYGRVAFVICRDFFFFYSLLDLKHFSQPVDIVLKLALTPVTADFAAALLEARRSIYAYYFFL